MMFYELGGIALLLSAGPGAALVACGCAIPHNVYEYTAGTGDRYNSNNNSINREGSIYIFVLTREYEIIAPFRHNNSNTIPSRL